MEHPSHCLIQKHIEPFERVDNTVKPVDINIWQPLTQRLNNIKMDRPKQQTHSIDKRTHTMIRFSVFMTSICLNILLASHLINTLAQAQSFSYPSLFAIVLLAPLLGITLVLTPSKFSLAKTFTVANNKTHNLHPITISPLVNINTILITSMMFLLSLIMMFNVNNNTLTISILGTLLANVPPLFWNVVCKVHNGKSFCNTKNAKTFKNTRNMMTQHFNIQKNDAVMVFLHTTFWGQRQAFVTTPKNWDHTKTQAVVKTLQSNPDIIKVLETHNSLMLENDNRSKGPLVGTGTQHNIMPFWKETKTHKSAHERITTTKKAKEWAQKHIPEQFLHPQAT